MFRQSPRRNQRTTGIKVKHVVQISLLLGVCFWLLYQALPSRHKKASMNEQVVKLGRKDVQPLDTKDAIEYFDDENKADQETHENDNEENGKEASPTNDQKSDSNPGNGKSNDSSTTEQPGQGKDQEVEFKTPQATDSNNTENSGENGSDSTEQENPNKNEHGTDGIINFFNNSSGADSFNATKHDQVDSTTSISQNVKENKNETNIRGNKKKENDKEASASNDHESDLKKDDGKPKDSLTEQPSKGKDPKKEPGTNGNTNSLKNNNGTDSSGATKHDELDLATSISQE